MPRKQKTIHYLYKTTCLVTNRFYIGIHSTDDLNDGYLGSGKRLRYSIRKHGKENHIKEVLEFFDCREDSQLREFEVVNSELINHPNCMNLVVGGGGFMLDDYHYECARNGGNVHKFKLIYDQTYRQNFVAKSSEVLKETHKNGKIKYETFTGKKHSEEAKQKMRKTKNQRETNSQFGTMWVTNGNENMKIKKEDIIPVGWYKGRI